MMNEAVESNEVKESKFVSITGFVNKHGVPTSHVKALIDKENILSHHKKTAQGKLGRAKYYVEDELLSHFIELPKTSKDDLLIDQKGRPYRTLVSFIEKYNYCNKSTKVILTKDVVKKILKEHNIQPIEGLDSNTIVRDYYNVEVLSDLCGVSVEDPTGAVHRRGRYYPGVNYLVSNSGITIRKLASIYKLNVFAIIKNMDDRLGADTQVAKRSPVYDELITVTLKLADSYIKELVESECARVVTLLKIRESSDVVEKVHGATKTAFKKKRPQSLDDMLDTINNIVHNVLHPDLNVKVM